MDVHPSYYAGMRREVSLFVEENYGKWVEENPDWFTQRVKATIPKDMVPMDQQDSSTSFDDEQILILSGRSGLAADVDGVIMQNT